MGLKNFFKNLFTSTATNVATTALESAINGDNRKEIKNHVKENLRESARITAKELLGSIGEFVPKETKIGEKYNIKISADGTVVGEYKNVGFAVKVDPINEDTSAITLSVFGRKNEPEVPSVITGFNVDNEPIDNSDDDYKTYDNFLSLYSRMMVSKIRNTSIPRNDLIRKVELNEFKLVLKDALDIAVSKNQLPTKEEE